jgi:hypothetical protein
VYLIRLVEPTRPVTVARDISPLGVSWSSRGLLAWQKLSPRAGIYVSDARGDDRRRIVRTAGLASLPHWSYDGRRLAFACEPYFCEVRRDGSGRRRLDRRCRSEVDIGGMAWSPDGRQVACIGRLGDLITARLGTQRRRIVRRRPSSALFLPVEVAWQRAP